MRLRKTDSLLAIGLVLILLWTPAFVAQGEDAREHATGRSFRLPPLTEGTVLTYDLLVHVEGTGTVAFPDFASVTFRFGTPAERARGGVYIQDRSYEAIDHVFTLDGTEQLRIQQKAHALRIGHDAAGWPNVAWQSGQEENDAALPYELFHRHYRENNVVRPGTTVRYAPDPVSAFAHDATASLRAFVLEGHDFPDPTATHVAVYEGRTLYGATRPLSDLWEFGGSYDAFESTDLYPWPLRLQDEDTTDPQRFESGMAETWYAEDVPVPAGYRWKVRLDSGEGVATIDIVPGAFQAGTGEPLPMRPNYLLPITLQEAAPSGDRIRVGDLMHHDRPVFGSVSLAWLHAQVRVSGPDEVVAALDAGAFLTGFSWEESVAPPEPAPSILPPIPLETARLLPLGEHFASTGHPLRTSVWHLDYALDARRWLVQANVTESETLEAVITLDGTCPRPGRAATIDCDPPDPDQGVTDPHLLAGAARRAGIAARPGLNATFTLTTSGDGLVRSPYLWHAPFALIGGKFSARQADDNGTTHLAWAPGTAELAYEYRSAPRTTTAAAPLAPLSGAHALQSHEAVGYTAAGAGILLALAGALPRLLAWLRFGTGGFLAAGLYAKIARSAVLDNERRNHITSAVENDPGLSSTDLAKRLGYGWGSTLHHLGTLERNGLLSSMTLPGGRYWFLANVPPQERLRSIAKRHGPSAQVLDEIAARPGATLSEIVDASGLSKSVGSKAGKRLEHLGLVVRRREGRNVRYFPAS